MTTVFGEIFRLWVVELQHVSGWKSSGISVQHTAHGGCWQPGTAEPCPGKSCKETLLQTSGAVTVHSSPPSNFLLHNCHHVNSLELCSVFSAQQDYCSLGFTSWCHSLGKCPQAESRCECVPHLACSSIKDHSCTLSLSCPVLETIDLYILSSLWLWWDTNDCITGRIRINYTG